MKQLTIPTMPASEPVTSIDATLTERGNRYGDFADHAIIAQNIQDVLRDTNGWERLSAPQRQALTVIADKIARILSVDPYYQDNWHDIAGYAILVERIILKGQAMK